MWNKQAAKPPTRANSEVSLGSTRTGDTQPSLPTGRSGRSTGISSKGSSATSIKGQGPGSMRSAKKDMIQDLDEDREEIQDFDLGTFFNFADWYGDDPYMTMALALFEKAPPGSALRSANMLQVLTRRYKDVGEADQSTMDDRDKCVSSHVVFTLPTADEHGNFTWDTVSFRLPVDRDKQSREARMSLLKYMDSTNSGRILTEDLKLGLARIVSMPGLDNPEHMLDEVVTHAQRAVSDLMLDGMPRNDDDILSKEFRIFLTTLQGYMDLWEIFFEVDDSGDELVRLEEFIKAAPKLVEWGMKDPALTKNPEHLFGQIDKDESGYVTFGEFADFCVRKGLMEEIAKEARNM